MHLSTRGAAAARACSRKDKSGKCVDLLRWLKRKWRQRDIWVAEATLLSCWMSLSCSIKTRAERRPNLRRDAYGHVITSDAYLNVITKVRRDNHMSSETSGYRSTFLLTKSFHFDRDCCVCGCVLVIGVEGSPLSFSLLPHLVVSFQLSTKNNTNSRSNAGNDQASTFLLVLSLSLLSHRKRKWESRLEPITE